MSYAIFKSGGKQHRVSVGEKLDVEMLELKEGDTVTFNEVLAAGKGDSIKVGTPILDGASVMGKIVKQHRAPKVIAFKFKRRKGYHRKKGHRQHLTRVEITAINA